MAEAGAGAAALELWGVVKSFRSGGGSLLVLDGIDLTLNYGSLTALVGPSGAGKSTLLHIAGLLERPDRGQVTIAGEPAEEGGDRRRTALRRARLGFVYQHHHLLREFSAQENVEVPLRLQGRPKEVARSRAAALLDRVGLGQRLDHRPGQLSGGEQQRVAMARALVHEPALLIADEPTGNLDPHTAEDVFALLVELVRERGMAALIATHNLDLAARADRVLSLTEGRLAAPGDTGPPRAAMVSGPVR